MLPPSDSGTLEKVSPGLNEPFRERPSQDETLGLDWIRSPVVWAPALLLLAALAVYLLPEGWLQPSPPALVPAAQQPLGTQAVNLPASAAAPADSPSAPQIRTEPASPSTAASAPVVQAAVPAPAATAPKPVGASPLLLRAKAQTWIEVTDARGQVQFSRLMQPGEQAELDVALPAQLRVGNVAGTEALLRGASLDLAGRSKDNVARIELN
jgi:cytoskeleton protein RodZ